MHRMPKCSDPKCRTNKIIKGFDFCVVCKANKVLKFSHKYTTRNYIYRGIWNDAELSVLLCGNNTPYNIKLSYFLSRTPRQYMRLLLGIAEGEDIEYKLLKRKSHYETKAVVFGKHRIMWIKLDNINYVFTPGQITIPLTKIKRKEKGE